MRVAIEAASLALSSGGLARYTAELSVALARCFPEDEYYLISDQPFRLPQPCPSNLRAGGGPRNAIERRWWLWGLAREADRLGADVVHGPDFAVPYIPRRPSVLTLHDLSPWMDPGWHANARRVARRTPLLLKLGIATMVVTPSEAVRKQAIARFHLRADRVVAVPEAAAPWLQPVETRPAGRYFLFVGTLEPRKNLPALVEAWRAARRECAADLALVGRRRADCPHAPSPGPARPFARAVHRPARLSGPHRGNRPRCELSGVSGVLSWRTRVAVAAYGKTHRAPGREGAYGERFFEEFDPAGLPRIGRAPRRRGPERSLFDRGDGVQTT